VNIGLVGHVDHGKTTLTKTLTGVWTDAHSEEIKRGITIRLGYADAELGKRRVAFVDAPGHETLMAVMLSGAAIMDGAVLVIAANEKCPQPQTIEHLVALNVVGIENIVIVQNKVDLVNKEEAIQNYEDIKAAVEGTSAENAPIIPMAAHYPINTDALVSAMDKHIPTPERDLKKPARMFVARSFDINKPGADIKKLKGGVIGGSLIQGKLKVGDEIELRPGIQPKEGAPWQTVITKIEGMSTCGKDVKEAIPGGLIGIGTQLDPAITKTDQMIGNVVGKPGTLPEVFNEISMEVELMERVVGTIKKEAMSPLKMGEILVLNIGTAATIGTVTSLKGGEVTLKLKRPVCAESGWKAAISRRIDNRWRLIGYGTITA
jgi:translation initiation factor 2 subunit 3